jgi:NAD(P) transhydrogenase subunit alpha
MVVAFIPKESEPGEARVAAVPETVKALRKLGVVVKVQQGAGLAAGYTDDEFREAGAEIEPDGRVACGADLVLRVRLPRQGAPDSELKTGSVLVCSVQPALAAPAVKVLADRKVTTFSLDLVPRITRAQRMDVLSSQATAAGYKAVLLAASALPRFFPMLMTAAGTIPPARVFVLGAGVSGLQAIATARRLGALVEANDVRPSVKEQVESLGAKYVDTGAPPDAQGAGGYAKETTAEYQRKQREVLTKHIAACDVLITTAAIPGKRAPQLVTGAMVDGMRPGSVIVDLAAASGGNVEGTVPGETVVTPRGVKIIGDMNLAALVAADSSRMFARNVLAFVEPMVKEGKLQPKLDDEVLAASLVTHDGAVRHEGAAAALAGKGAS